MRARLKPSAITTRAQKKAISDVLEAETERRYKLVMRRFFKLMCITYNDEFGHGKRRLMRAINRISTLAAEHANDEVYWTHVDRRIEQLGLEFSKEDE